MQATGNRKTELLFSKTPWCDFLIATRLSCRSYTRVVAAGIFTAMAAVMLMNWLVDPFGVYWGIDTGHAVSHKAARGSRIGAAERLKQQDHSTVLLGTSRVLSGLDASSPVFNGHPALNVGLMGANFYETFHAFAFAARQPHVKQVLLCVDFYQFNSQIQGEFDFDSSRFNPELSEFDYHLQMLLGWRATRNSARLAAMRLTSDPPKPLVTPKATLHPSNDDDARKISPEKERQARDQFEKSVHSFLNDRHLYGRFHYSLQRVEMFGDLVRIARDKGIRLHVAILPVHAVQLETIRAAGLWDDFEQWKRDLVAAVDAATAGAAGFHVPVWDFTGYRSYPAAPIDSVSCSRYYYEAAHFSPALGEKVLRRMLTGAIDDPEFGIELNSRNVEIHLAGIRADRNTWVDSNREEPLWVQAEAERVSARR